MVSQSSGYYYLIEGCVEFRPEENLLSSHVNGEKITLFVAASRCLQLLLNQRGMLVTQQALFDAGWQNYGVPVTNNTFYQNILTIRKAFKLAGCDKALIKTVPRQGLTIPAAIHVEIIAVSIVNSEPINESVKPEEPLLVNMSATNNSFLEKIGIFYSRWAIVTYLAVFFSLLFFVCNKGTLDSSYFDNYRYVGEIEGCSVYAFSSKSSIEIYTDFLKEHRFYCKQKKIVYFATYRFVQRASIIRCEQPFKRGIKNNCISEYYLDWLENNE
jgi:DNA-binding winged helix-turn-helix (wHTH) protein